MNRILILSLLLCGWGCGKNTPAPPPAPNEAAVAPTLPIYEDFADLAALFEEAPERPTLINFWATWCAPCVEELPYLEQLRAEVPDEELRIVLVSLDFPNQIDTKLKPFLQERELKSEVLVLTDGRTNDWIDRVNADWDGAIPVTLIRTAAGADFHRNKFSDYAALRKFVDPYLL